MPVIDLIDHPIRFVAQPRVEEPKDGMMLNIAYAHEQRAASLEIAGWGWR